MSNQTYQQGDLLLVNRVADSFTSPYGEVKTNILDSHLIQSDTPPNLTTYPDLVVGTIWIDTSQVPPVLNIWDGTQWNEVEGGGGSNIAEPVPGDLTFSPPVTGGGTQADPFVLDTVTSYTAGGTAETLNTITISNQEPFAIVLIDTLTGGIRFEQDMGFCDASGVWTGKFYYLDTPTSTAGDTFDAKFKIGLEAGVFLDWQVIQIANKTPIVGGDGTTTAPNASPASVDDNTNRLYGTGTGTWADGSGTLRSVPSVTRSGTNDAILFGVDASAIDKTDKAIIDGQTITVIFDETVVDSANDGDRISGAITNDAGFYQEWSMVKKTSAAPWSIDPLVDQAKSDTVVSTNVAISGINAQSQVDLVLNSATLANVAVSVNGAAFDSGFPVSFNPGDTLQFQGDTGQLPDEEYVATFSIGGTEATWSVTTVDTDATIVQPTITAPADGTADLAPDVTLVSSAYDDDSTGAGTHTESDWVVYEADLAGLETDTIDKVTDTTLQCMSPQNLGEMLAGDHLTMEPAEYTLKTTDIESVSTPTPANTYELRVLNPDGNTVVSDPGIFTDADLAQASVNVGEEPTATNNFKMLLVKLDLPSIPYFVRYLGADPGSETSIWHSDDGINWTYDATYPDLPGPGDQTIAGSVSAVYWAWGFTQAGYGGRVDRYGVADTATNRTTLTFPGDVSANPDLQYFQAGDVVSQYIPPGQTTSITVKFNNSFPETENVYIGGVKVGGKLLVDNANFTDSNTQINIGTASANATGLPTGWANGIIDNEPNDLNSSHWRPVGNTRSMTISWTTPVNLSQMQVLASSGAPDGILYPAEFYDSSNQLFSVAELDNQWSEVEVNGIPVTVISTGYPNSNTMVVDGGAWEAADPTFNTSQNWTQNVTGEEAAFPASSVFDRDNSTYYYLSDINDVSRVMFNTPLGFTTSVEVSAAQSPQASGGFADPVIIDSGGVDGAAREVKLTQAMGLPDAIDSQDLVVDVTTHLVSPILGIGLDGQGAFKSIKVDGKFLVNKGDNSQVVFGPVTGEADFVSATGNTATIENVSGRWIGENSAGTSFVAVSDRLSSPGAPATEPPGSDYTKVDESLADTTNLTSYTLDNTVLQEDKAYYSKVKYRDDTAPDAIESEWSPWNEFTTKSDFTTP